MPLRSPTLERQHVRAPESRSSDPPAESLLCAKGCLRVQAGNPGRYTVKGSTRLAGMHRGPHAGLPLSSPGPGASNPVLPTGHPNLQTEPAPSLCGALCVRHPRFLALVPPALPNAAQGPPAGWACPPALLTIFSVPSLGSLQGRGRLTEDAGLPPSPFSPPLPPLRLHSFIYLLNL